MPLSRRRHITTFSGAYICAPRDGAGGRGRPRGRRIQIERRLYVYPHPTVSDFGQTLINGAGATFPFPIYAKWADAYKTATGNGLNYQSIGSGAGIKQIKAKTVTFGATDAPLKPKELDDAGLEHLAIEITPPPRHGCFSIPW